VILYCGWIDRHFFFILFNCDERKAIALSIKEKMNTHVKLDAVLTLNKRVVNRRVIENHHV
jgi:hypothetical protein